ncbi:MAG: hypothetical protein RLZZ15_2689 [Verrucomicrobiota bacterium]|jgi:plasmid stabilization system protein ParE
MPFRVNWTQLASSDLREIEAYIAADNVGASRREVANIIRKVDQLELFPKIGPVYRHTSDAEYRSVICGNYRIIYFIRPGESVIDITTVRHGAQDEPDYL